MNTKTSQLLHPFHVLETSHKLHIKVSYYSNQVKVLTLSLLMQLLYAEHIMCSYIDPINTITQFYYRVTEESYIAKCCIVNIRVF